MARQPTRTADGGPSNSPAFNPARVAANPARVAAEIMRPQIEQLHRDAERVVENRRRLINSITDPSLRRTVR